MAAAASSSPFSPMDRALAAFARGEFVVVMDDEGRENEGDLLIAASECTTEKMAWFIKHTSCVTIFVRSEVAAAAANGTLA